MLLLVAICATICGEIRSENAIEIDDILSVDFMPGKLLVLENPQQRSSGSDSVNLNNTEPVFGANFDGSVDKALSTMGYHRSMMNEYLCRSFVAEQIVAEMSLSKIQKRVGHGMNGNVKKKHVVGHELLQDEGSSSYRDWLSKSTALEDIYRHYSKPQNRDATEDFSTDEHDNEDEEDYSNHLVGYAYAQQPAAPSKLGYGDSGGGYYSGGSSGGGYHYPSVDTSHTGTTGHSGHGGGYSYSSYGGGYGNTGVSGYAGGGYSSYSTPPKYHGEVSSGGKEHDLADLFDIAITALAYLSFGMFIVHVIMCISMTNNQGTTTTAMMPMSMSPTAVEPTGMTSTGGSTGGTSPGGGTGESDSGGDTAAGDDGGIEGDGDANEGGGSESEGGGEGGTTGGTGGDGGAGATSEGDGSEGMGDEGGDGGDSGEGSEGGGDGGDGNGDGEGAMDTDNGDSGTATGGTSTGSDGDDTGNDGDDTGNDGDDTGNDGDGDSGSTDDGDGNTGTDDGGSDDSVPDERDPLNFRIRRDIPTITQPNNIALNELAKRVLSSIEAAFVTTQDNGECLRKSLCENNKFSRTLEGSSKIWIPVWSLGMSWLSGKLINGAPLSVSTLDSLKASILGLGNANCDIIYQKCDLMTQRKSRRRRRRRR